MYNQEVCTKEKGGCCHCEKAFVEACCFAKSNIGIPPLYKFMTKFRKNRESSKLYAGNQVSREVKTVLPDFLSELPYVKPKSIRRRGRLPQSVNFISELHL